MSILRRILVRLRRRLSPDYKGLHTVARAMRKAKREDLVMGVSGCGKAILAIEPLSPDGTCVCCGAEIPEGRWVCPICAGEFGGNMK